MIAKDLTEFHPLVEQFQPQMSLKDICSQAGVDYSSYLSNYSFGFYLKSADYSFGFYPKIVSYSFGFLQNIDYLYISK